MKALFTLLLVLLLASNLGLAQQQQNDRDECKFTVQGEPAHVTVTGPDDLVPLVYVVNQPDSPLEILSIDLEGMWLSVSGERYIVRECSKYQVRNRSDRVIERFWVSLGINNPGGGGARTEKALSPGQTTEVKGCNTGGDGPAPQNRVKLIASVDSVNLGGCHYQPSLRIPSNLGLRPWR